MAIKFKTKLRKRLFITTAVLLSLLLVSAVICLIYLMDYYHADLEAIEAFAESGDAECTELEDGNTLFMPDEPKAGLIFYPGGKVENTSYIPLMEACANEGILCVLVEMPFRLAVFDSAAAEGIMKDYPEVERWYIGGHSLGGAMAASYLAETDEEYEGLILLAAYSTEDLSDTDLKVLSVYGSEDRVLDAKKYKECLSNLPNDLTEEIIEGGNHAYFGMYGEQSGDGKAGISNAEQIEITAKLIEKLIMK